GRWGRDADRAPVWGGRLVGGRDLDLGRGELERHVDVRQRKRVAERDQVGRPLRRHDPGKLGRRQGIALRKGSQLRDGRRRHTHDGARDCATALQRLVPDVDHADRARFVDVREVAHGATLRDTRSKSPRSALSHADTSFSRACSRIAAARAERSSSPIVSAPWSASAWPATSKGLTLTAQGPSSSCAPAFSESTSTPSRVLTSGASFATRFNPSYTAFTSSTSNCL